MIGYDQLSTALDRYNRRLRGEVVPELPAQASADTDGFDIMEEAEVHLDYEGQASQAPPPYPQGTPDITAETLLPDGRNAGSEPYPQEGYGSGPYPQQGYDSGSHPQQGYDSGAYPQQEQPQVPGSGPGPGTPYPGGNDPYRQ